MIEDISIVALEYTFHLKNVDGNIDLQLFSLLTTPFK